MNERIETYLSKVNRRWNYITPRDFYHKWFLSSKMHTVIDLRRSKDFRRFHIPGAINIFWLDILKHLDKIPRDIPVFLICYVGHTSSQTLVLLHMLGYSNVRAIKFGYGISPSFEVPVAGWTQYNYPLSEKRYNTNKRSQ